MRFTKMQAAGNDYVYMDTFKAPISSPEALARRISDRHFGVGSDGLILICPPSDPGEADFRMRMFLSLIHIYAVCRQLHDIA